MTELPRTGWTKKEDAFLKKEYNKYSIKELSDKFGKKSSTVYNRANKLGLSHQAYNKIYMSKKSRKYGYNDKFFDKIDSEEKAYFLGLLYADDYNRECKGIVSISLHQKDIDILIRFKKATESEQPIGLYEDFRPGRGTKRAVLTFSSARMSRALALKGCFNKKSKRISFPLYLDRKLMRHFIRGFFDGDGSAFISNNKVTYKGNSYIAKQAVASFISNTKFITELRVVIMLLSGVKHGSMSIDRRRENCISIAFHSKNCIKMLDWLYSGTDLYMKRKYDTYKKLCTLNKGAKNG